MALENLVKSQFNYTSIQKYLCTLLSFLLLSFAKHFEFILSSLHVFYFEEITFLYQSQNENILRKLVLS